jgi:hypothetical protein
MGVVCPIQKIMGQKPGYQAELALKKSGGPKN